MCTPCAPCIAMPLPIPRTSPRHGSPRPLAWPNPRRRPAITELLALSPTIIRKLFYVVDPRAGSGGAGPKESSPAWLTDDVLNVEAIYAAAISSQEFAASAIARKEEALAGVDRLRQLLEIALPDLPNKSQARELSNSLVYFHSIASTVANMFIGFVEFARWLSGGRQDEGHARSAIEHLQAARTHWQMHIQRHAALARSRPACFMKCRCGNGPTIAWRNCRNRGRKSIRDDVRQSVLAAQARLRWPPPRGWKVEIRRLSRAFYP